MLSISFLSFRILNFVLVFCFVLYIILFLLNVLHWNWLMDEEKDIQKLICSKRKKNPFDKNIFVYYCCFELKISEKNLLDGMHIASRLEKQFPIFWFGQICLLFEYFLDFSFDFKFEIPNSKF